MNVKVYLGILVLLILARPVQSCRMMGIIALPEHSLSRPGTDSDYNPYMMAELEEFRLQGGSGGWPYCNEDGWGMTSHSIFNGTMLLQSTRSAQEAFGDDNFYPEAAELLWPDTVKVLLGHLRITSSGAGNIENPHPFLYTTSDNRHFSFGHNGDLNKTKLRNLIGDDWLNLHPPATHGDGPWDGSGWSHVVDSELFFFWIMKNIETSNTVLDGITEALTILESQQPSNIKNFILTDGDDLYAYRRSRSTDIHYHTGGSADNIPLGVDRSNHNAVMSTPPPDGLASSLPWIALEDSTLLILKSDGSSELINPLVDAQGTNEPVQPTQYLLSHAYPNPFNGETTIPFWVSQPGEYRIRIFNSQGRQVYHSMQSINQTGVNDYHWQGKDKQGKELASGSYYFQIGNGTSVKTSGKLLFLK